MQFSRATACRVHAYVLMPNHVHFLLTPSSPDGCTDLVRAIHQRYSQFVNRTMGRVGTLWQGRFWSSPVDTASYFLTCHRYIEMNPVRAGLCTAPGEYPWSSFRANALGEPSMVLSPHDEYLRLGADAKERQAAYRALFREDVDSVQLAAIRDAIKAGLPVGSEEFVAHLEKFTGRRLHRRRSGPKAMASVEDAGVDGVDR